MTSEQQTENIELPTADPNVSAQSLPEQRADPSLEARPTETDVFPELRPLSNLSSNSGNTEESLSTFAEQTLRSLAQIDPSLDVTFLSALDKTPSQKEAESNPLKASESEALSSSQSRAGQTKVGQQKNTDLLDLTSFDIGEEQKKNYFETDASEVEDIYDSAGEDGLTDRPTSSIVGFDLQATSGESPELECPNTNKPQGPETHKEPSLPAELSVMGGLCFANILLRVLPLTFPGGTLLLHLPNPKSMPC